VNPDTNIYTYSNKVPDNPALFRDHFPGDPLVPGALLSYWVCDGLLKCADMEICAINQIKFFQPLRQNDEYTIEYTLARESNRVKFICRVGENVVCKGSGNIKVLSNE